jgi:hypothetical protein
VSYLSQYKAAHNEDVQGRVIACVRKVGVFVLNEATTVPGYQRRRNLAEAIVKNPEDPDIINAFLWECVSNGTIESSIQADGTANAPDSDFEYVVGVVWDTVVNLQRW